MDTTVSLCVVHNIEHLDVKVKLRLKPKASVSHVQSPETVVRQRPIVDCIPWDAPFLTPGRNSNMEFIKWKYLDVVWPCYIFLQNTYDGYPSSCPWWRGMGCLLWVNPLRPRQNGRHFAGDTLNRIFLNENVRISTKISLKFAPKGPINKIPALVQIISEPMMVSLLTLIFVTRPQWVIS